MSWHHLLALLTTLTFGHSNSYAFAHSGHDQFRLRLGEPGIDKRHDNPSIFKLAASAPEAAGWRRIINAKKAAVALPSAAAGPSLPRVWGATFADPREARHTQPGAAAAV